MKYHLILVGILVLALSVQNSNTSETKYPKLDTFLSGVNQFSADFYESLARNTQGNFISSPVSALMVLAMAAYGAGGNTRQELIKAIHLPIDQQKMYILSNLRFFINVIDNINVRMASKLFIDNQFEVDLLFQLITKASFQSKIMKIDFKNVDEAADTINKWCLKRTNNVISNVIQPADLHDAKLVLVNAIYFKGKWVEPFVGGTYNLTFNLSKHSSTLVPMMINIAMYNHGQVPDISAEYIEFPYQTDNPKRQLSMYIIIPNENEKLDTVSNNMHKIDFRQLNSTMKFVNVLMPRFKIESDLDLKPTLSNMGIHDLFEQTPDFSHLGPENNNLQVTKVVQKAFIKVDEEGTEAAAITAMPTSERIVVPTVAVNKPFIAAIVLKTIGTPLFLARIYDPRS